jgi:hypothetical protein
MFGFWGGLDPPSICTRLTGVGTDFWVQSDVNQEECFSNIERHFASWMVLVGTTCYFAVLITGVWTLLRSGCCRRRRAEAPHHIIMLPSLDTPKTKFMQYTSAESTTNTG